MRLLPITIQQITRNRWSTEKAFLWAIGSSTGPGFDSSFHSDRGFPAPSLLATILKLLLEFGGLDRPVMVSFDVKNAEERAAETTEVYVGDQHASVPGRTTN